MFLLLFLQRISSFIIMDLFEIHKSGEGGSSLYRYPGLKGQYAPFSPQVVEASTLTGGTTAICRSPIILWSTKYIYYAFLTSFKSVNDLENREQIHLLST